ncbi:hypothetical protein AAY473_022315 [Plecturocebus cupreus]
MEEKPSRKKKQHEKNIWGQKRHQNFKSWKDTRISGPQRARRKVGWGVGSALQSTWGFHPYSKTAVPIVAISKPEKNKDTESRADKETETQRDTETQRKTVMFSNIQYFA